MRWYSYFGCRIFFCLLTILIISGLYMIIAGKACPVRVRAVLERPGTGCCCALLITAARSIARGGIHGTGKDIKTAALHRAV